VLQKIEGATMEVFKPGIHSELFSTSINKKDYFLAKEVSDLRHGYRSVPVILSGFL
jgi:hypothetical protein